MSTEEKTPGRLYIVGTPIGNLDDITIRAAKLLESVSLIAAEDTRRTRLLLNRLKISRPLISYNDFNKRKRTPEIVQRLLAGEDVALVSDAGMPCISDPGYYLIKVALGVGIGIIPIPGPSAVLTALSASGLPTDRFVFEGFVEARTTRRERQIKGLVDEKRTIIMFESPHRLLKTLECISRVMGNRRICVARELTKVFEEFVRGDAESVLSVFKERGSIRGEITLVIQGKGAKGGG